jgi:butyryl-CoA dehydrogenase
MQIDLTDQQRRLRDTCRDLAERELRPQAKRWDRERTFPAEAVGKAAKLGLSAVAVPAEWGGAGGDNVGCALAVEELSRGCASVGLTLSVQNSLYCAPVMKFGTDAQRERFLRPFARGEKLGCFGLAEPEAGADAAELQTRAVRKGGVYVLEGTKSWVTNGPVADAMLLFAVTDPSKGAEGISAFLADTSGPGLLRRPDDEKLGVCASPSCSFVFEGFEVPVDQRLGGEGDGLRVATAALDGGRIGVAAQAIGIARAAFEEARDYAKVRKVSGVPIAQQQAVQFLLADMATELDAARLLTLRAASLQDAGAGHARESAMAKLYASEMSGRVTDKSLQIHGGMGLSKELAAERHFRDARITQIVEGTGEIQRLVISHALLQ